MEMLQPLQSCTLNKSPTLKGYTFSTLTKSISICHILRSETLPFKSAYSARLPWNEISTVTNKQKGLPHQTEFNLDVEFMSFLPCFMETHTVWMVRKSLVLLHFCQLLLPIQCSPEGLVRFLDGIHLSIVVTTHSIHFPKGPFTKLLAHMEALLEVRLVWLCFVVRRVQCCNKAQCTSVNGHEVGLNGLF